MRILEARIFLRDLWSFLVDTKFWGLSTPVTSAILGIGSPPLAIIPWAVLLAVGVIRTAQAGNRLWKSRLDRQLNGQIGMSITYRRNPAERLGYREIACTVEDPRGVRYQAQHVYGGGQMAHVIYPQIFGQRGAPGVGPGIYTVSWSEREVLPDGPGNWHLMHVSQFEG